MLNAFHAQESKATTMVKVKAVSETLCAMKLLQAAKKVEDSVEEILAYAAFPLEH